MTRPVVKRPCKACGFPLVIADGPNGKAIPLDARAPTYEVKDGVATRSTALVSHFSTCPEASRFSGTRAPR